MSLLDQLKQDLNAALKQRDTTRVRVLRLALSDLHNRRIDAGRELEDEEVLEALRKGVKMRQEAAEQFAAGGREERASEERAEIVVLEAYLPKMLEGEALEKAVDEVIADTGASSPSDMGKVMGELMDRYRGRIDGKAASALVRQRLGA